MPNALNELIDLTPAMDAPTLAARGTVYAVLRERGESDFIASTYALRVKRAERTGAPITAAQLHAFYDFGPAALAA